MSVMEKAAVMIQRHASWWGIVGALLLIAVIGFIDYVTGYEVPVYPFYAAPIVLAAWFSNRHAALAIMLLCAVMWWWADEAGGHVYKYDWLREWITIVRVMFFSLMLSTATMLKQQRDVIRARVDLLERSQRLEREIISVSEREQQRIGRDLHDGMCQYLAAVGFSAELLKQDLAREAHPRAAKAGEIAGLLQEGVERVRDVARGLSPVDRDGGLESALDELAAGTTRLIPNVTCTFLCSAPTETLDHTLAVHLFRIAQEAISNATRHGRARSIIIALEAGDGGDGELSLRVTDDGVGFDQKSPNRNGMGLNIMHYRAHVIGGTLEIYRNLPTGTVVSCTVGALAAARKTKAGQTPAPAVSLPSRQYAA